MQNNFPHKMIETCDRCQCVTASHIMSMFNADMICMSCKDKETQHPQYVIAQDAERAEVSRGNYNFAGIGKPADL